MNRRICIEEGCNILVWARKKCKYHDSLDNPEKYQIKAKIPTQGEEFNITESNPLKKKKVSYIAPISDRMKDKLKEYRLLRDEYMSNHLTCEVESCNRPSEDLHHVNGRGINLCNVDTWLAVCRSCHEKIHREDKWARESGYLGSRLS